ncbi:MAG: thioesterase family protein [Nannocystaceae bacterium]
MKGQRHLHVAHDLPVVGQARVLYADTDGMGVVYHGTYVRYLEQARIEFLRARGTVYAEVERSGNMVPVTDLAARYTAPARFDDLLTLHAGIVELTRARLRFAYRITVEPGDRAGLGERLMVLVAETGHCCLDARSGRPVAFPPHIHGRLAEASRGGGT